MNSKNGFIVTKVDVQHSEDECNRHLFENLEMRRLGLPTEFSSAKSKNKFKKKKKKKQDSVINRLLDNWNEFQINSLDDFDDKCDNHFTINSHHLIKSDVNIQMSDNNLDDSDECDIDLLGNLQEGDVLMIDEDEDDCVEEVNSIIMSDNSYDYQDIIVNEFSCNNNNESKSDHKDYDEEIMMNSDFVSVCNSNKNTKSEKRKSKIRMNNYWRQRFILFSRFNEGIKLDKESWYSVTPEAIAKHIAERLQSSLAKRYPERCDAGFIVMDPFCGAGGNVIQFALQSLIQKVYAFDIDLKKINMAKHNARIYECLDKIEFICGDFFELTKHNRFRDIIDACFYSPPWGGPNYIDLKKFSLNHMEPNGFDICRHTAKHLTQNIIMLLPRNFDETELQKVSDLVYNVDPEQPNQQIRMVELERNMIFNKVKTITAYFGDMIDGFNENPTKVLFETK